MNAENRSPERPPTCLRLAAGLVVGLAAIVPGAASAQISGDTAKALADTEKSALPPSTFGGELGFGQIGEDFFLNLNLRLNMDFDMWGFGLQAPVRLRLIDKDPKQDPDDYLGVIRREDWDQVSDFFKFVRYVYVGQRDKKGPFYVRAGELTNLTVGHGTIMHRYYNTLDIDRWHLGLNAAVNIWAIGAEVVINDVTDPYVIGSRVHVRPLQIAFGEGWPYEALHVGVSVFTDYKAPYSLRINADGSPQFTQEGIPEVDGHRPLFVTGADVGFHVLDTDYLDITPYVDFNKIGRLDQGWGFHAGVLWNLSFPAIVDTLVVDLRTEYRRVAGDYLAPYFNSVYEIERLQRLVVDESKQAPPKFYTLRCNTTSFSECLEEAGPGKNGLFFELTAGLPSFVLVGGDYIDYDGGEADGSLRLWLEVPALDFLKLSAFYYRVNVEGLGDLFKLDDRSAVVAQASVPIYFFSVNLRYTRVWEADEMGGYDPVHNWDASIGFSLEI